MDLHKIESIMGDAGKLEIDVKRDDSGNELRLLTEHFAVFKYFLHEKGMLEQVSQYYDDYKASWDMQMLNMVKERLNCTCESCRG